MSKEKYMRIVEGIKSWKEYKRLEETYRLQHKNKKTTSTQNT